MTLFKSQGLRLHAYLHLRWNSVEGWLDRYSGRFIADLTHIQRQNGICGAFGEIGVHHGKLFILMRLAAPEDVSFAIDVFEDQHLNVDHSGAGSRTKFMENVIYWTGSLDRVAVIQKSSLEVSPESLFSQVGPCRMVSIDGGHTEQCTVNDLKLSEAILQDKGIAIIDDCFDEGWPDVATGVARYCLDRTTRLRPFAISPNKVYFAHPQCHAFYKEKLQVLHGPNLKRVNRMFGSEVLIFRRPQKRLRNFPRRLLSRGKRIAGSARRVLCHLNRLWT